MEEVMLGTTVVANLLLIGFGITSQIYKNYQTKSTENLSLWLFIFSFFCWSSWAVYGFMKQDWFLLIIQGIGALMTAILLVQFFIYRKSK